MNTFLFYAFALTFIIGLVATSVSVVLFSIAPGFTWGLVEVFVAILTFLFSLWGLFRTGLEGF